MSLWVMSAGWTVKRRCGKPNPSRLPGRGVAMTTACASVRAAYTGATMTVTLDTLRAGLKATLDHTDLGTLGTKYEGKVRDNYSQDGRRVLVVTDRLVPAEKLIEVVDQCRLAGAKDVGVASEREAG